MVFTKTLYNHMGIYKDPTTILIMTLLIMTILITLIKTQETFLNILTLLLTDFTH
jgi:hypothetical protein